MKAPRAGKEQDMEHSEMIEKLQQKAHVTYEEAELALVSCDWDLLDALLMLEGGSKSGAAEEKNAYTTQERRPDFSADGEAGRGNRDAGGAVRFGELFKKWLRQGNTNHLAVSRNGRELVLVPITVAVLLMILSWPWCLAVLLISLFFGFRFAFKGPDIPSRVNDVMSSAQEKAAGAVEIHTEKQPAPEAGSENTKTE